MALKSIETHWPALNRSGYGEVGNELKILVSYSGVRISI
jgi:hypothetical protein